jgi:mono/diheme cytochrome c family protein
MMRATILLFAGVLVAALAADQATLDKGKREEQRVCQPCHSLRLIHSQRLSRATWTRELDKMAGWGTSYQEKDALLEYLVATYGDDKPMTPAAMSQDGRKK